MRPADLWARIKRHPLSRVGPGLVTGVADDDPSGIVTYSQAGAQFGFNMLWTMPLAYPLMSTIQVLCARIGRVTGRGLSANMKLAFHPSVLMVLVVLLLFANVLNIAADIAAMGEVAQLVTGINWHIMTTVFVLLTLTLQILIPYRHYVFFLKWLSLSLLAYGAVLFTVHVPWSEVVWTTLLPDFTWSKDSAAVVVGIFGTTISPYLFFWQASQEVEDMNLRHQSSLLESSAEEAKAELRRIQWDTWSGMLYSNVAAYCIILATAVTLYVAGIRDINTAAQAASALRPLAGDFAFLLFALGILGVGLMGVPVLAGSAAYALSEVFGWRSSLEDSAAQASKFYSIIAVSVLGALAIQYSPISPMKALFWSAVINGVVAVPLMIAIMLLSSKSTVMGSFVASKTMKLLGWLATAIMALAALSLGIGFVINGV
ncbi:NRAMP family divalent metal transporter [Polynucleobacter sp. AP-Kolm-20A-A1]|uniref:NRAMP family divalent metal transporter n=1 Tax=Polynucleobacter sp. AP-Kolm-20A-A1 TaxID=2081041 RepID=UPI001BFEAE84|nr:divalent metal cation transporter [Polynucleobacter sp. AP-Kolm-20A-A1]QWE20169.1 divalent metal cation transporter [Polynucleobacter sp. AP-Kolm-20A-A1]